MGVNYFMGINRVMGINHAFPAVAPSAENTIPPANSIKTRISVRIEPVADSSPGLWP
jgi:hypothetical protein